MLRFSGLLLRIPSQTYGTRSYVISRFPGRGRPVGSGRRQPSPIKLNKQHPSEEPNVDPSVNESPLWRAGESLDASGSGAGLERLLANDVLVVERWIYSFNHYFLLTPPSLRQIEMLNVFIGFEQTNKYSISKYCMNRVECHLIHQL